MTTKIAAVAGGLAVLCAVGWCVAQSRPASSGPATSAPTGTTSLPASRPAASGAERPARLDALGDPLPPGAVARLGTVRLRYTSPAFSVAFSPDGATFATGHGDGRICIWERSTGRLLRKMQGVQGQGSRGGAQTVWCLLYVAKDVLVSGSSDGSLRWWDANSGAMKNMADATAGVTAMAPGADGKSIVVAAGRTILVYDATNAARLDSLTQDKVFAASIATVPGDGRIFIGGQDGNIHIFHLRSRKDVGEIPANSRGQTAIAASSDGRNLAWAEADGRICLADIATGAVQKSLVGHLQAPCCLVFSPDGRLLASRSADDTIRLWNVSAAKELWQADSCGNVMNGLAFSPDGRFLAVARVDKSVDLLDAATGKSVFDLPGHTDQVYGLAISPDGGRLASGAVSSGGSIHNAIRMWDLAAMREVWRASEKAGIGARHISWRADGKVLATCGSEKKVRLWDANDGHEIATMGDQPAMVTALTFRPEGNAVLFARQNGTIGIWHTASGEIGDYAKPAGYLSSLAISRDGRWLAAGAGSAVQLIDVADPATARTFSDARGVYWGLRFLPDGASLVGAGASGISLWEIESGALGFSIPTGRKTMWCIDHSPDGRLLVSAGGDGNVDLWETITGERVATLGGHAGPVYAVAFLPDPPAGGGRAGGRGAGARFCSAGADTQILVWSLDELFGAPVAPASEEELRQGWELLADDSAARAFQAHRSLAAGGEKTVAFIRERLKPAPPPDEKHIRQLIKELDSDKFAAREAATEELRKIGRPAAAQLRAALDAAPSAEVRQRAADIMEALARPAPILPELKQALRAIAVMEAVGGESAKETLSKLAAAADQSPPARHARAALTRMRAQE